MLLVKTILRELYLYLSFSGHLSWNLMNFPARLGSVCPFVYQFVNFSHIHLLVQNHSVKQSPLGLREFKFVQMKEHVLLQGEIITKYRTKIHWYNLKDLQNHWTNFNQTTQENPRVSEFKLLQIRNIQFSKKVFFLSESTLWYSFAKMRLLIVTVAQVSDVAHGPLVFTLVDVYSAALTSKI